MTHDLTHPAVAPRRAGTLFGLAGFANRRPLKPMHRAGAELACVLAFLGGLFWATRNFLPLPQMSSATDLGILLDAGWRFTQGQLPHRDYISPLGPAYALIAGLPLVCCGVGFESYKYLPLALCGIFALLAFLACRTRAPSVAIVFYSIVTGVVAGGTYQLGYSGEGLTFATLFNRVGSASTMVLAAAWGLPRDPSTAQSGSFLDGLLSGLVIGFLLFLKTNFFVVAIGMFVVALFLNEHHRGRAALAGVVFGFSLTAVCFLAAIDWSVGEMIRDLLFAAQARRETWLTSGYWRPGLFLATNAGPLTGWCAIALCAALLGEWRRLAYSASVLLSGFLLACTNSSGNGFGIPLVTSGIFILGISILKALDRQPQSLLTAALLWGAIASTALSTVLVPQLISYASWSALSWVAQHDAAFVHRFNGSPRALDGLVVGPTSSAWEDKFVELTREGVETVRTFVPKDKTLLYVDYTNIMSFAASAKSPRNTFLWIDKHATLSKARHPNPGAMLQGCDFVMLPRHGIGGHDSFGSVEQWLSIYGDALEKQFEIVDDGQFFVVYQRKQ